MDQNNLPSKRENTTAVLAPKLVAPAIMSASVIGILFFEMDVVFTLTCFLGLGVFITRSLIKKSLKATHGQWSEDPILRVLKEQEQRILQAKFLAKHSSLGEKAHAQSKELNEHFSKIMGAIKEKFNPSELAFSRYESALVETTTSLMENLKMLNSTIHAMEIASNPDATQMDLVQQLSRHNDEGIKLLGNLLHSLNQINAGGSMDATLETSLDELKRLTEQTKKYSR